VEARRTGVVASRRGVPESGAVPSCAARTVLRAFSDATTQLRLRWGKPPTQAYAWLVKGSSSFRKRYYKTATMLSNGGCGEWVYSRLPNRRAVAITSCRSAKTTSHSAFARQP